MIRRASVAALVGTAFLMGSTAAEAAPPTLVAVGPVKRHASASWALAPGAITWYIEVSRSTGVDEDGYFLNPVESEGLDDSQTSWRSFDPLRAGTYYVHVSSHDAACYWAGTCPYFEWSQIQPLVIPAPPPEPAWYQARLSSIHPGAVPQGFTYRGDTLRASFRNATARAGERRPYKVCVQKNQRRSCVRKTMTGRAWSSWRVRMLGSWVGFENGRYTRRVRLTWHVGGERVQTRTIRVYE